MHMVAHYSSMKLKPFDAIAGKLLTVLQNRKVSRVGANKERR